MPKIGHTPEYNCLCSDQKKKKKKAPGLILQTQSGVPFIRFATLRIVTELFYRLHAYELVSPSYRVQRRRWQSQVNRRILQTIRLRL